MTDSLPAVPAQQLALNIFEEYGIAEFNKLCRESAFSRIQDWERMTDRIAYWVDLSRSYVTYTNPYIESVWWSLKEIWK